MLCKNQGFNTLKSFEIFQIFSYKIEIFRKSFRFFIQIGNLSKSSYNLEIFRNLSKSFEIFRKSFIQIFHINFEILEKENFFWFYHLQFEKNENHSRIQFSYVVTNTPHCDVQVFMVAYMSGENFLYAKFSNSSLVTDFLISFCQAFVDRDQL